MEEVGACSGWGTDYQGAWGSPQKGILLMSGVNRKVPSVLQMGL